MVGSLESRALLARSIGAAVLLACPQLLDDDFYSGVLPDAGLLADYSRADAGNDARSAGQGGSAGGRGELDSGVAGSPDPVQVQALSSALAHRYSFSGTGTTADDSVGDADGTLFNTSLEGRGEVSLGGSFQVVNLPNGLVSAFDAETIEAWVTWHGGAEWQRVFDFGSSSRGESERGVGVTYLYLVPKGDDVVIVAFTRGGYDGETRLYGTKALPVDRLVHVAVVIDGQNDRMSFYLDGALNASKALAEPLSGIDDINVWIGMSQYAGDPPLQADVTEFRIYGRALADAEVALSYQLGADSPLLGR